MIIVALAIVLASPAILYAIRVPSQTNVISALHAVGLFAAVFTLVRRFWLQLLIGLPVMLLNLIEIVHVLIYGQLISLGGVESILHAVPYEVKEFALENAGIILLGFAVVAAFACLAWLRSGIDTLSVRHRLGIAGVSFGVPVVALAADLAFFGSAHEVYLPTRVAEHYVAFVGANPLTQTISGLASSLAARSELRQARAERDQFRFNARQTAATSERQLHIVIIGESSRRRNWSLYGYGRPTSPRLAREPNLVAFTDAISPATVSHRSIAISFSMITPETVDLFQRSRTFVSAFREAGFKSFWLSNQGVHRSAVGSEILLMMDEAEVVRSSNFGFWNSVLDEKLLPLIDEALIDPAPRKLLVIHTLGSHSIYRQRVPANWRLDPAAPPVRVARGNPRITDGDATLIDDYDRTISYTDWLVSEIIGRHRATGQLGSVVYLSDHGQRLLDDEARERGHGFRDLKPEDVDIPLLVWLPDRQAAADPVRLAAIRANATRPVTTAQLGQSLLDLAGIDIGRALGQESFFGPDYRPRPRSVIGSDGAVAPYRWAHPPNGSAGAIAGSVQTRP
ncbi:sulfatase-like hydrolase/transferase [Phreatobacter sp.]|uniref:sulfatase-like hydrolase/transferase n=1 Tax=Phreatobacter sp. TaxID=1966341 RepID=UPI003F700797